MKFFSTLRKDIRVVFERDPAAKSVWEVVLCYPGLHAIWAHRLSHALYKRGWVLLPRLISEAARFLTGIEIHPGATIGEGLFIDHGTGIVIGETAELGRNVTLYQGVTLGGTGKETGKRHPTIGDNVVVASGAKVLGSFTVGSHAKIGAGAVVLKPVPAYATVVGVPGRVVVMHGQRVHNTEDMRRIMEAHLVEPDDRILFRILPAHDDGPAPAEGGDVGLCQYEPGAVLQTRGCAFPDGPIHPDHRDGGPGQHGEEAEDVEDFQVGDGGGGGRAGRQGGLGSRLGQRPDHEERYFHRPEPQHW